MPLSVVCAFATLDEIDFINKVVNDPLLVEWLDKIKSNVLKVVRSSKQIVVIIDGP